MTHGAKLNAISHVSRKVTSQRSPTRPWKIIPSPKSGMPDGAVIHSKEIVPRPRLPTHKALAIRRESPECHIEALQSTRGMRNRELIKATSP